MEDKPVAEIWFSINALGHGILHFREARVDGVAVGDIWLARKEIISTTGQATLFCLTKA